MHQLIHWAAVGVMVPVLTLVLRELGLSLFEVGLAMAAYSITTVVLEVRAFASGSLEALAVENIRRQQPDFDLQRLFARVGMAVPAGLAATSLIGGFLPELASLPVLGAAYFGVAVLASYLSPSFVRLFRGNRAMTLIVYRILSGTVLMGLAVQTSIAGFAVAYLGFFFLFCVAGPVQSTMLNELLEDSRRSTLISANSLIQQAGAFIGALVFGAVSQRVGIGVSWSIAGAAFMLSALLFLLLVRNQTGLADLREKATA